jgi:hypothetical protein
MVEERVVDRRSGSARLLRANDGDQLQIPRPPAPRVSNRQIPRLETHLTFPGSTHDPLLIAKLSRIVIHESRVTTSDRSPAQLPGVHTKPTILIDRAYRLRIDLTNLESGRSRFLIVAESRFCVRAFRARNFTASSWLVVNAIAREPIRVSNSLERED